MVSVVSAWGTRGVVQTKCRAETSCLPRYTECLLPSAHPCTVAHLQQLGLLGKATVRTVRHAIAIKLGRRPGFRSMQAALRCEGERHDEVREGPRAATHDTASPRLLHACISIHIIDRIGARTPFQPAQNITPWSLSVSCSVTLDLRFSTKGDRPACPHSSSASSCPPAAPPAPRCAARTSC